MVVLTGGRPLTWLARLATLAKRATLSPEGRGESRLRRWGRGPAAASGCGQKKGSIRRWSPSKVGQTDEGGGNAVCRWIKAEGGGSAQIRCRETAGPREEDSVGRLSDRLNMCATTHSSKAGADMSAMHLVQGRSA